MQDVTDETLGISEYLDFGFYDHVSYKDNPGIGMKTIGRCLGVSHRVGGLMSYWILNHKIMVISRTTFQCITSTEN